MVSSEVQRTLVKSPPELFSELSDPEALARHLGALGEIRITKTKPEQTVEWEAEAAQGKVELKQSGWGTRVTLTIRRELPQPPAARAPDADVTSGDRERALDGATGREPAQAPETAADPAAVSGAASAAGSAQRKIANHGIEPAFVSAETSPQGQETGIGTGTGAGTGIEAEADPSTAAASTEAEAGSGHSAERPGRRLGLFFARLLGRRRARRDALAEEPAPAGEGAPAPDDERDAEDDPQASRTTAGTATEATPGRPADAATVAEPDAEEPAADAGTDAPAQTEPASEAEADTEPGPEPETSAEPEPGSAEPGSGSAEREPGSAEREPGSAEPEPGSAEPAAPVTDPAALERQIALQDTEVLTAVLDRLGAAHHRPFSRA